MRPADRLVMGRRAGTKTANVFEGIRTQRQAWMDSGRCAGDPHPNLWFPDERDIVTRNGEPQHVAADRYARMLCDGCPVQNDCYQYAVDHDLDGIWGGTTYRQRHKRPPRDPK